MRGIGFGRETKMEMEMEADSESAMIWKFGVFPISMDNERGRSKGEMERGVEMRIVK